MNLGLQMSVKRNTRQASLDLHNWISLTCWYQDSHNQIRAVSKVNSIKRCETHTSSPLSSQGAQETLHLHLGDLSALSWNLRYPGDSTANWTVPSPGLSWPLGVSLSFSPLPVEIPPLSRCQNTREVLTACQSQLPASRPQLWTLSMKKNFPADFTLMMLLSPITEKVSVPNSPASTVLVLKG